MRRLAFALTLFASTGALAQEATIGTQITTTTNHEGMNIYLVSIDGKDVDSGTSMWSDDKNLTYPLTPGSHTLGLQVAAGAANEKKEAVLFVNAGQQYSLGAETVMNQQTGEPSSYMAWIQDNTGARVWAENYTVTTTTTFSPSPWQH